MITLELSVLQATVIRRILKSNEYHDYTLVAEVITSLEHGLANVEVTLDPPPLDISMEHAP